MIKKLLYRYLRNDLVMRLASRTNMSWPVINKVLDACDQKHVASAKQTGKGTILIVFSKPFKGRKTRQLTSKK